MDKLIIDEFEELIKTQQTVVRHEDNQRWGKYQKVGHALYQNSLHHTLQATRLGNELMMYESILNPSKKFNKFLVSCALLLHDEGEIEHKDVIYGEKNDSGEIKEVEFFMEQMLPSNYGLSLDHFAVEAVREMMVDAFMLQFGAKEGKFEHSDELREKYPFEVILFEGIERLGYLTDAYHFHCLTGSDRIMAETLGYQHDHMVRLCEDIVSLDQVFYTPEVRQKVEKYMEQFAGKQWEKLE